MRVTPPGLMTRAALVVLAGGSVAAVVGLIDTGHVNVLRCGSTVLVDVRRITGLLDEVRDARPASAPGAGVLPSAAQKDGQRAGLNPPTGLGSTPPLQR